MCEAYTLYIRIWYMYLLCKAHGSQREAKLTNGLIAICGTLI